MGGSELVFTHDENELTTWGMWVRPAHPRLRAYVAEYEGIWERTPGMMRRRYTPARTLRMFLNFGEPMRVAMAPGPRYPAGKVSSFVAGPRDGAWMNEHDGSQQAVAVYLTPEGAHALFQVPMYELANAVVDLDELLGARAEELSQRLAEAAGWAARMDMLDRVLSGWFAAGPQMSAPVAWAWGRMLDSHGRVRVGDLADQIGWSRRHLIAQFREQVGLPPKRLAEVLRFERAVSLVAAPSRPSAEIAAICGYSDQAHLAREFRTMAGLSITEYRAVQLPKEGGTAG